MTSLAKLLEAALFASARPIATDELAALDSDASGAELQSALDEIREHYDVEGHGVELVEIGGGWQILRRKSAPGSSRHWYPRVDKAVTLVGCY